MSGRQRMAIDGGQTGTRIRVFGDGTSEHNAGPIYTDRPVVPQIAEVARDVISATGADVGAVAAGVSGLTPQATRPDELLAALAGVGPDTVALAHDSVSAYLAANRFEKGAVIAAGTGVVTLGVGDGGVARVDGWGHLVGDAGSGYWIGRAGLDAALRAYDGRGAPTPLEQSAHATFGPLPELYMALQADPERVAHIAGFAREVSAAARTDDTVAVDILQRAAAELADSVRAALRRSDPRTGQSSRVSWMGNVLTNNDLVRTRFIELIGTTTPDVTIAAPYGDTLDGVALLLEPPEHHPLVTHIHRA
ncbi:BadF/BadG/BcrA/BcrD ATPase family protein [Gordonia sp. Z-3]|uniref:N-acetylglucosamine kinase n=1 Tax=Gordonia sp. Z-3 TaxID=3115408 RepID=UPI002E27FA3B|nr:BadF/BadG/BcrA/BcrD ATPase family protein [Gordonia sp. Z-3]MED5801886.1 BadF/BadG/BcrA/BcrD ATPase family protein [Gordonia sp. Z-3]